MSIGHTSTPMLKTPKVLKFFIVLCTVPVDFHIWYTRQMKLLSISGMSNIVPRQTNYASNLRASTDWWSPIRYPALGIIHTVSGFRNFIRNTLLQVEDIVIACRKWSILNNFKYKFLHAQHGCLSILTSSMQ